MKQKLIIAILAALLIGGGAYFYIQNNNASAPSETDSFQKNGTTEEEEFVGDVPGDPADNSQTPTTDTIAVSTQVAGSSVTIDNVFLSKPGFISIHEVSAKGQPDTVIGNSGLLSVGAKQDLEVKADLEPGAKYIAMIRTDNGDKKFNAEQDTAVFNNDLPVMVMFSVSQ
jgi:hypothetical protein